MDNMDYKEFRYNGKTYHREQDIFDDGWDEGIKACQFTIKRQEERIKDLEQLCRDCYYCLENAVRPDCMAADLHIKKRMKELGLIERSE